VSHGRGVVRAADRERVAHPHLLAIEMVRHDPPFDAAVID
jgi:hypothetical protein